MGRQQLHIVMTNVALSLQVPFVLDETLSRITAGALDSIPGVDHASLSVTRAKERIQTLAPTDPVAQRADQLQYQLREGPCYDATMRSAVMEANDLATDQRWSRYGRRAAAELGLRSQLAFQFSAPPNARGALNLYSRRAHQITPETHELGALFAQLAAVALGWTRKVTNLETALTTRNLIGQAVGIVMERYHLDADRAFSFLVRTSQDTNTRLRDIAERIITDAIAPQ